VLAAAKAALACALPTRAREEYARVKGDMSIKKMGLEITCLTGKIISN
jgi:hypothetical protein